MSAELWDSIMKTIPEALWGTVYMTLFSTLLGYLFGLPLGVLLTITSPGGIRQNRVVYRVLDIISNIFRSIPFLILMVILRDFTRSVVGKSYGPSAVIIPLTVAAIPFIARMVESSLREVNSGVIEAASSMGAGTFRIIWKVLLVEARTSLITGAAIATATILGYSAMAGAIGGGGLGDVAIQAGYYRNDTEIMWVSVILIILLIQVFQGIGMGLSKKFNKRVRV